MRFHFGDAVENGTLEIELHHHTHSLGEAGIHADGEIECAKNPPLNQPAKRRQGLAELVVGIFLGVVALLLRAEDPFHFGVVIEERKEYGHTLDNRGAELGLDPFPIGTRYPLLFSRLSYWPLMAQPISR